VGLSSNILANAEEDSSNPIESVNANEKAKYQDEFASLTEDEIVSNYERIDQQYDVGEELSLKDQTFIEMYAKKPASSEMTLFASKYISESRTVDGVTVSVKGTIKHDINNIFYSKSRLKEGTVNNVK